MKKEKDKNHLCFHYEAEEEVKPHKIACYLSLKNTGDRNSNKKKIVKKSKKIFFLEGIPASTMKQGVGFSLRDFWVYLSKY